MKNYNICIELTPNEAKQINAARERQAYRARLIMIPHGTPAAPKPEPTAKDAARDLAALLEGKS